MFNNSSEKNQYVLDFNNNRKLTIRNKGFTRVTKDANENYWVSTPGPNFPRFDPELVVISPSGEMINSFEYSSNMPQVLGSNHNLVYYAINNTIYLYDLEGNVIKEMQIAERVSAIYHLNQTLYIAAHDFANEREKIYIYNMETDDKTEIEGLENYSPSDIKVYNDILYWTSWHSDLNQPGMLTIYNEMNEKIDYIELSPSPGEMYVNEHNEKIYIKHRVSNSSNIISEIDLRTMSAHSHPVPSHNRTVFSDDAIYLIYWAAQKMEKYSLDFQYEDELIFDFNVNNGPMIPGN